MKTLVETTTRELWEKIVARFPEPPISEWRRKCRRRPTEHGAVELTYKRNGKVVVRTGPLLDVSPEGIMIRHSEMLAIDTPVLIRLTLGKQEVPLAGRVVHSTQTLGPGFKVGIKLIFTDDEG